MAAVQERFPYKEIEPYEAELITTMCGGEPQPQRLLDFFEISAQPMLANSLLPYVLPRLAMRCAAATDVDPGKGGRAFVGGALFYTGVLANLNSLSRLPCTVDAFGEYVGKISQIMARPQATEDDRILAKRMHARISEEARTFCELSESMRPTFGTYDEKMHALTLSGAGLIHVITTESLRRVPKEAWLDHEHPELSDLEDTFGRIEREFGN